jgi:hypothetical protein
MDKIHTINQHIGTFDGYYTEDFCSKAIKFFEYRLHYIHQGEHAELTNNNHRRNNILVSDNAVTLGHEYDFIETMVLPDYDAPVLAETFKNTFWQEIYPAYTNYYPEITNAGKHRLGTIKIQRTIPGEGYHVWHFENGSYHYGHRLAFVIMYLNTINDGGETEFIHQSLRVQPIAGRLIIAPSTFTHTHRGNQPLTEPKYIITTWLEYND